MSAYSTLRITRYRAVVYLINAIGASVTDEQLGDMMDVILRDRLYNCRIVANDEPSDEDRL